MNMHPNNHYPSDLSISFNNELIPFQTPQNYSNSARIREKPLGHYKARYARRYKNQNKLSDILLAKDSLSRN